jgi:predicted AAA+ superfamily ATPase
MYKRTYYLEKIEPFIGKPVIKVITGMRRVGKSYFVRQIIEKLKTEGIHHDGILYINMELMDFAFIKNYQDLHQYVKKRLSKKGPKYLFVDEIQEISGWEKTITSLLAEGSYDIFIAGSNAQLLSSEIATLISGRYIEFPLYSLTFNEFLVFRDVKKKDVKTEFLNYLRYGGFPVIHHFDFEEEVIYQYISSLFNTILLKDVIRKHNVRNINLLENLTLYLFDNIGNIFSARRISDYLKSQNLKIGIETVQNYISYISSTFAIHKVPRFDIKGKQQMEMYEKYYLGDIGLRHALLGYREGDISGILENIVFIELKKRGYRISIGKWAEKEIDFIAQKPNEKLYFQVSYLLSSPEVVEREFSSLKKIKDNYPKYVLSMDTEFGSDIEGIRRLNIIDFLLNQDLA